MKTAIPKKKLPLLKGLVSDDQERSKSRQRTNSTRKTKTQSQAATQITSARKSGCSNNRRSKEKKKEGRSQAKKKSLKKKGRDSMDMTYVGSQQYGETGEFSIPLRRKRNGSKACSPYSNDSFSNEKRPSNLKKSIKRSCTPMLGTDKGQQHRKLQVVNAQLFDSDSFLQDGDDRMEMSGISKYKNEFQMETCQGSDEEKQTKTGDARPSSFFEKEFQEAQKELLQSKAKIYEYRYKVESLKKRLGQREKELKEAEGRFEKEQAKSDEFYSKCEKYKLMCKECKKEIDKMKKQVEKIEGNKEQEVKSYEEALRNLEEQERVRLKEGKIALKYTFHQFQQLHAALSRFQLPEQVGDVLSELYEGVKRVGEEVLGGKSLSERQDQSKAFYIGDGQTPTQFKVSQDEIMFNGESLPDEESCSFHYQHHGHSNMHNCSMDSNALKTGDQQKSHTGSIHSQTVVLQGKGVLDSSKANNSQEATLSINHSINAQQYEMLVKIQNEMQKVKEESKKVIEENNLLADKNADLHKQLSSEKKSVELSLLPQYKEAFEQMRATNEVLEKKVLDLQGERQEQSQQEQVRARKEIEEQIQQMKFRMQKFEYENNNLREEREVFLNQIQSLETYNKTQEKMLNYFQNTYQQVIQTFQQQQMALQPVSQPGSHSFSLNSTSQIHPQLTTEQVRSLDSNGLQKLQQNHLLQQRNYLDQMQRHSCDQRMLQQIENLDQQFLNIDVQSQSQPYFSNRSMNSSTVQNYQLQSSQAELQSASHQKVPLCPALQSHYQALQQRSHQSQHYMETSGFENNSRGEYGGGEREDIFSLSSTQPEVQMKLLSPMQTFIPKQEDFKQSNTTARAGSKAFCDPEELYQSQSACGQGNCQKVYPPTTTSQQNKNQLQAVSIEELKSESQEITNRDKQTSSQCKTYQGSGAALNGNQILEMDEKENSLSSHYRESFSKKNTYQVLQELEALTQKSTCKNKEELKELWVKEEGRDEPLDSLKEERKQANTEYLCSQETFNAKETYKNNDVSDNVSTSKQSSSRSSATRKNSRGIIAKQEHVKQSSSKKNKENQKIFSEQLNHSFNAGVQEYSNVKSPTFLDPDVNEMDSELGHLTITSKNPSNRRNAQNSNLNKGLPLQDSSHNQLNQGSISSNFMSERTLNLKKEITSLDEEILQLQNSLKQALMRKDNDE